MTRKKIKNRDLVLIHKVGVRFDAKTYAILKDLVQRTNSQSVGGLVRRIIEKDKILFYAFDTTIKPHFHEFCRIREELNSIGRNINQVTHHFHLVDTSAQKIVDVLRIDEHCNAVKAKVDELQSMISVLAGQWLDRCNQNKKIEVWLENFEYIDHR